MTLVGIAELANAAFELYAATLLDHMCRLVRGGVQVRRAGERHVIASGEGLCADRVGPGGSALVDVRLDVPDVMAPERLLDLVRVRQARRTARDAVLRCGVHCRGRVRRTRVCRS